MSDKGGFQSSLFAGMNLGPSKASSSSLNNVPTSLLDKKETELNSSTTAGSSFSFIKDTETGESSSAPCKEKQDDENRKILTDNTASLLDLFDMLDEGDSSIGDVLLPLSYSEQLAEILPSTTPLEDTLSADISGGGSDGSSGENSVDILEHEIDKSRTSLEDENIDCGKTDAEHSKDDSSASDETDKREMSDENLKDTTIEEVSDITDTKYSFELEPEENVTLFYSQHSFKLAKLREEREELQHNICSLYKDVKSKMISLDDRFKNLKTDFDEALCNDDYDLASEVNEQIEELNTEKLELRSSTPKLMDEKIQEYLSCVIVLRKREREFHEWALTKYQDLQSEQNDLLEKHKQRCSNEINDKKQDLEHEKDNINRSLQHLQLDKEHLEKDRTDLDDRINARLEVFQNKKKELFEKQTELEREIELLEKRLKELRSEKKKVECFVNDEDDKMAEVRKEFESLELKLNEKCDEIKSKEEMLNEKLEDISAKEKKLDEAVTQEREKEESLVKNIRYLTRNKEESETFIETTRKEPDKNISGIFFTNFSQDNGDSIVRLKSLEKVKAKELQDLELQEFNKEQGISTKTKRLDEIQNQLPEFEKAKKSAVTEHNFKEAKRINEMLKRLASEIETTREDVEQMKTTLTKDKQRTELLKQEYASVKNDVIQVKENYDLSAIERIVNKMKTIVEMDTSIAQDSLLETIKREELNLLKTEFNFLEEPSESVLSRLSESNQEKLTFVKEFLAQDDTRVDTPTELHEMKDVASDET